MEPLAVLVADTIPDSPTGTILEADDRLTVVHTVSTVDFEAELIERHDDVDVVVGVVGDRLDGPTIVESARAVDETLPVVLVGCPPQGEIAALASDVDVVIPDNSPEELLIHSVKMAGDHSRAEEAADRYRTLVETVGDAMYLLDENGTIEYVNDIHLGLSEYSQEELVGSSITEILPDEVVNQGNEAIKELLSSPDKEWARFESLIRDSDGNQRHYETNLAVLTDGAGTFEGSVGVVREITARKENELMLERQNEQLEQFANVVSHDLRNPLTVARGYLESGLQDGDLERSAQEALVSLDRMETIIEDVLTLARKPDGVDGLEHNDLEAVVSDAWASVATEDATLRVVSPGTIEGDRSQLQQLFENLFRNAVEHSSGPVTVRVGRTDTGFYVEDTGPGVPAEIGEEIFEWEVTNDPGGTGFGLTIVAQITHAHGWEVSLAESDEGGARFEFTTATDEE